ncbi:MAG: electron transport complex subunit RsxE [Planctomycetes bacterium]|nr:electron transport complex subunit RsxE [Planctomycetota bacterium]
MLAGAWNENPIAIQILGICSALAVTRSAQAALVMGAAVTFTAIFTNLLVSLLRRFMPQSVRLIVQMLIIATFVSVLDELLKAFHPEMSKELGAYVPLIITNCIPMGRAEGFALRNGPALSMLDGAANGLGYTGVLLMVGSIRELAGNGTIAGFRILGDWYVKSDFTLSPSGAFIVLGLLIVCYNAIRLRAARAKEAAHD